MTKSRIAFLVVIILLIFAEKAHAYIDLGMGSMLIQALIAALISVGIFWRRFLSFFKRLFGRKKDE